METCSLRIINNLCSYESYSPHLMVTHSSDSSAGSRCRAPGGVSNAGIYYQGMDNLCFTAQQRRASQLFTPSRARHLSVTMITNANSAFRHLVSFFSILSPRKLLLPRHIKSYSTTNSAAQTRQHLDSGRELMQACQPALPPYQFQALRSADRSL